MSHTPHELPEEFPESAALISQLKQKDRGFAQIADEYHKINQQIYAAEAAIAPMNDEALENLKKQRLALKDKIAARLAGKAKVS